VESLEYSLSFSYLFSTIYLLQTGQRLSLLQGVMWKNFPHKQTLEFRYISGLESETNRVLQLRRGKLIEQNRSPHWRWKYWSPGNIGGWSYQRFHCILFTAEIAYLGNCDTKNFMLKKWCCAQNSGK